MQELTRLIYEDMNPALGVTEPGAIAFSVAKAKSYVTEEVDKIRVLLNSGMYKNAFTCGIPNSSHYGNLYAAALGALAGDEKLGLECLRDVDWVMDGRAEALIQSGAVKVELDHMGSDILIDTTVWTNTHSCRVLIQGSHTNIVQIECDGKIVFTKARDRQEIEETVLIHRYSLQELLEYIRVVPVEELRFIEDAFEMNVELLKEGIETERTSFIPWLWKENGARMFSDDPLKTAQLLCNGAIEARVLGLGRPAMSVTGSGAHGIIATLPLYAYYKVSKDGNLEALLRSTALSILITMYIKEYSGRLSAFCGCAIAAGTGMACGLCSLSGQDSYETYCAVIQNMASGITGMICDGGNQGCVMKGIVAVDAAFKAVRMAAAGVKVDSIHGINGRSPEETMRNMGRIASPGMVQTEETIVEIMKNKQI